MERQGRLSAFTGMARKTGIKYIIPGSLGGRHGLGRALPEAPGWSGRRCPLAPVELKRVLHRPERRVGGEMHRDYKIIQAIRENEK